MGATVRPTFTGRGIRGTLFTVLSLALSTLLLLAGSLLILYMWTRDGQGRISITSLIVPGHAGSWGATGGIAAIALGLANLTFPAWRTIEVAERQPEPAEHPATVNAVY
jgi:hypothetical protein